jgi:hypothetical protein
MKYTLGFELTLDLLLDYLEGSKEREFVVAELKSWIYMTKKGVPIPNTQYVERHMREVFPFLTHAEIDPITAKLFVKVYDPVQEQFDIAARIQNRKVEPYVPEPTLFKIGGVPATPAFSAVRYPEDDVPKSTPKFKARPKLTAKEEHKAYEDLATIKVVQKKVKECVSALMKEPSDVTCHSGQACVPKDIMQKADWANNSVSIDWLALGKPGGDIFNSDHWMYDQIRDRISSTMDYATCMRMIRSY